MTLPCENYTKNKNKHGVYTVKNPHTSRAFTEFVCMHDLTIQLQTPTNSEFQRISARASTRFWAPGATEALRSAWPTDAVYQRQQKRAEHGRQRATIPRQRIVYVALPGLLIRNGCVPQLVVILGGRRDLGRDGEQCDCTGNSKNCRTASQHWNCHVGTDRVTLLECQV